MMCDIETKHSCTSPGEITREYYRLQGRIDQKTDIINRISEYCEHEHTWVDNCDCYMYIKIVNDDH
jgi:hypothetical protein